MNNNDLVAGLYGKFAAGDIATVVGMFATDTHWHEAESNPYQPSGEAFVGPDAVVRNLLAKLGEDWSEFTVQPASIDATGPGGTKVPPPRHSAWTHRPPSSLRRRT